MTDVLHGPLETRHRELGASFAEFGGWLMPVSYAGTVSEHTATRNAVGLFDVSHLGKALVRGPGAAEFVNSALTNDLDRIGPGKAQYTLCCNESGGVIDDLIAYYVVPTTKSSWCPTPPTPLPSSPRCRSRARRADHHRRAPVVRGAGRAGTEVGRGARRLGPADRHGLHGLRRRRVRGRAGAGVPHRLHRRARLRAAAAVGSGPAWCSTRCVDGGAAAAGGELAGLGARDTLRTEMGYPLHGHELSLGHLAAAGPLRLGDRLEEGRVLGPRRAAGREGGGAAAAAARPAGGGSRRAAAGPEGARRRHNGRRHHVGNILSDTESRHRAGAHRRRRGRRRTAST